MILVVQSASGIIFYIDKNHWSWEKMNFSNSTFKASLTSFKESISRIFVASALEPLNEVMNLALSWQCQLGTVTTCKCLSSGLNGVRWFARRRSRRTRCRPRTKEQHLFIQFCDDHFLTISELL